MGDKQVDARAIAYDEFQTDHRSETAAEHERRFRRDGGDQARDVGGVCRDLIVFRFCRPAAR
jgi:hypothetical protein